MSRLCAVIIKYYLLLHLMKSQVKKKEMFRFEDFYIVSLKLKIIEETQIPSYRKSREVHFSRSADRAV